VGGGRGDLAKDEAAEVQPQLGHRWGVVRGDPRAGGPWGGGRSAGGRMHGSPLPWVGGIAGRYLRATKLDELKRVVGDTNGSVHSNHSVFPWLRCSPRFQIKIKKPGRQGGPRCHTVSLVAIPCQHRGGPAPLTGCGAGPPIPAAEMTSDRITDLPPPRGPKVGPNNRAPCSVIRGVSFIAGPNYQKKQSALCVGGD